jgi:hypothetical protein
VRLAVKEEEGDVSGVLENDLRRIAASLARIRRTQHRARAGKAANDLGPAERCVMFLGEFRALAVISTGDWARRCSSIHDDLVFSGVIGKHRFDHFVLKYF